jgi:tRNA(Ile)-lysidine synthase
VTPLFDLQKIFAPLGEVKRLLVAVSGGPDSMALLHLAADWHRAGGSVICAATVDHGLRADARAEAEQVAQWCAALGVEHEILTWQGEKPHTRLQERARQARYDLLFAHAREIGADVVVTAHHADDQAETILFRLLRGSGIAGLAGMEATRAHADRRLARPLLGHTKAELVSLCETRRQAFFQDPSNQDPRFARTQLRQLLPELEQEGLDRDALLRLGRRAARMDGLAAFALAQLRREFPPQLPGRFALPVGQLLGVPEEMWLRLLDEEITRIGQGQGARLEQIEALCAALQAAAERGEAFRTTLGGVLVDLTQRGQLSLTPEPPRRV